MTYQEALEKIAELEAALEQRESAQIEDSPRFAKRFAALEAALAPVLGTPRFDEPLVIHDIRRALSELKDAL